MIQFLGSSHEHSPLVVNVRHLRTAYIGPEFHVIFDVLFQTDFSYDENDIVVDAICNQLFENNWDLYAEDKFSAEGELIYISPLLDDVRLFEIECQYRKEMIQAQWNDHEECQHNGFHHAPAPMPPDSTTDAAVISDDDSSADSSSDVELSESKG